MPMKRGDSSVRENFIEAMKGLQGADLQVGFFPSAKYSDKSSTPVAYVAAIHEFGSPSQGIPPRPFFRPTIANRKKQWSAAIEHFAKRLLIGEGTPEQYLEQLGLAVAGDIKKTISKIKTPALSPRTIKAKRRKLAAKGLDAGNLNKPLVETGLLIGSLTYEVTRK